MIASRIFRSSTSCIGGASRRATKASNASGVANFASAAAATTASGVSSDPKCPLKRARCAGSAKAPSARKAANCTGGSSEVVCLTMALIAAGLGAGTKANASRARTSSSPFMRATIRGPAAVGSSLAHACAEASRTAAITPSIARSTRSFVDFVDP